MVCYIIWDEIFCKVGVMKYVIDEGLLFFLKKMECLLVFFCGVMKGYG